MPRSVEEADQLGEARVAVAQCDRTAGRAQTDSGDELIYRLAHAGIKVNATALMTLAQVWEIMLAVKGGA